MAWRPCEDLSLNTTAESKIWTLLQSVYDNAYPTSALPRAQENSVKLENDYIIERQGVTESNLEIGYSLLPFEIRECRLGSFEIDILDWLFNCESDRSLLLTGPRGAGKSTFLHYIEYILGIANEVQTPMLFIVDMYNKSEGVVEDLNENDFAEKLTTELQQKASVLPEFEPFSSFKNILLCVSHQIDERGDFNTIIEGLMDLKRSAPWNDPRSFVVAFDNLDHLSFRSVEMCLYLARELLIKADVGSILSTRPSMYNRIVESNSAQALVSGYIRITPPSLTAWLENFPERMVKAYESLVETRRQRELNGITITAQKMREITIRISKLCLSRTRKDNTERFMEALSSHDMRHFNMLIRRMLQNRNLPSNWLFDLSDESTSYSFHPMFAIMQGARRWFAHNDYVPNLLAATPKQRSSSFLLFHRLLSLMREKKPPMDMSEIKLCMEEYSFDNKETVYALEIMRRANVVYGSDLDIAWSEEQLPEYCGLTESGLYFLNFLLSDSDYLVSAVLDVPLEHKYLSEHLNGDIFAPQIHSLHEYLIAVKEEENRQLSFMRRRPPSERLALASDRLRRGNTLTGKILKGFKDVVLRGINSASSSVKTVCRNFEPKLKDFEIAEESLEQALGEVLNKAMKRKLISVPPTDRYSISGSNEAIRVRFTQDGARLNANFTVHSKAAARWSFLIVQHSEEGANKYRDVSLTKSISDRHRANFQGIINDLSSEEAYGILSRVSAYIISLQDKKRKYSRFPAILNVSQNNKSIQIKITICRNEGMEEHDIGTGVEYDELVENWAKPQLDIIEDRARKNNLEREIIRGFGIELCKRVLSQKGITKLGSFLGQIEYCWLITDIREIPWEWLIPGENQEVGFLCDSWNICRTHIPSEKPFVYTTFDKRPDFSIKTIGLEKKENKKWRTESPTIPSQVLEMIDDAGIIHVVAHAEVPGELKFGDTYNWSLTKTDVIGYNPKTMNGPQEMIISSCNCGAVGDAKNIVVEISKRFNCAAWAPLMKIEKSRAEELDTEIGNLINNGDFYDVYSALKDLRKKMPFLYLYVRYKE